MDAVALGNPLQRGRRPAALPSAGRLAELLPVLLVFGAVFITHARWILTHFSSGGNLFDSGWFAYLFESGDPLLRSPSAVDPDRHSFYTQHISPYIYLFGSPLRSLFRLSGIEIFAYHQGLFFGLFFLSLYLTTSGLRPGRREWVVLALSAIAIGALSNVLLQAAAYPHYEIALLALASLAVAAYATEHHIVFTVSLVSLPLVREDGGLYAAFACLACAALDYVPGGGRDPRLLKLGMLALLEITLSVVALWVKAMYFPSPWFNFAFQFSGNSWDHVSPTLIGERLQSLIRSPNTAPVIVGSLLLAAVDLRYASGFVLLCPLFALYLLSVREELGYFHLYYALPWLLPASVWMAVFARRSRAGATGLFESAVLLLSAVALSFPAHRALGMKREYSYVVKLAFVRPVIGTASTVRFVMKARRHHADSALQHNSAQRQCASQGIAALVPNNVRADEVLYADSDLAKCHTVFLLRGSDEYGPLSARAKSEGFKEVAARDNASLWVREAK